jgi:hypothetical protein
MLKVVALGFVLLASLGAQAQTIGGPGGSSGGSTAIGVGTWTVTGGTPGNCLVNSTTLADKACAGLGANTFTQTQTFIQGTTGSPSIVSNGSSTSGISFTNSGFDVTFSYAGSAYATGSLSSFRLGSAGVFGFTSGVSPVSSSIDAGISRLGPASFAFGTITQGDFSGTLKFKTANITGAILNPVYTIANLLAISSPVVGQQEYVSDTVALAAAAYHASVVGGGAVTVNSRVSWNGSNWQYD